MCPIKHDTTVSVDDCTNLRERTHTHTHAYTHAHTLYSPLICKGAAAGADLTASGVLGDLLRLARSFT
jgi:homoserine dehydrogenase